MSPAQYKQYEHLGDGIYNAIVKLVIMGEERTAEGYAIASKIQGNDFMGGVGEKIGLVIPQHILDSNAGIIYRHNYADALEVKFYLIYKERGFPGAIRYFRNVVLPYCKTLEDVKSMMLVTSYLPQKHIPNDTSKREESSSTS